MKNQNQIEQLNKMVKVLRAAEEKLGNAMGKDHTDEVYAIYNDLCQLNAKLWNLRAAKLGELKAAATGGV